MKKRIISVLLVLIAIFYLCPTTAFAASLGDVSGDGQLNAQDSFYLRSYLAGKIDLEPDALDAADMNRDGSVTAADSFMLKRNIIGVQDTGYNLIVNNRDMTKSKYASYQITSELIEVPLVAVFEGLGAKVTYINDSIVEILYREKYILNLDEVTLFMEGYDFDLLYPAPGSTMKYRVHQGDLVLDHLTVRNIFWLIGRDVKTKIDFQNK